MADARQIGKLHREGLAWCFLGNNKVERSLRHSLPCCCTILQPTMIKTCGSLLTRQEDCKSAAVEISKATILLLHAVGQLR